MSDSKELPLVIATPSATLRVTLDYVRTQIVLHWENPPLARVVVEAEARGLKWTLHHGGAKEETRCLLHARSVNASLRRFRQRFPVSVEAVRFERRGPNGPPEPVCYEPAEAWDILKWEILEMGHAMQVKFSPLARAMEEADPDVVRFYGREARREQKRAKAQAELQRRMAETARKRLQQHPKPVAKRKTVPPPAGKPALPVPPVPVRLEPARFDGTQPFPELWNDARDLRDYLLLERASLWWVSNQSDDLLCLPHCAIEHLEYQLRTALRVLGPLQGRALLSDEVGLGKTIEAGLVLKEYLTRGMVKRFLVLTLPSLVDQWQEELESKFNIATITTNEAVFRSGNTAFWQNHPAIVASIHTLKQDHHLTAAQQVGWDLLIVDEAHYLRSRTAKTWQAVNALPRQFLLLLTATPVQNSIEEIYNLVTLLKPGQLPSPQEFRDRFLTKDKPREPRAPDELRHLLSQVMIRNTRANAGRKLPPRRAETALFEPAPDERAFWENWEREFRELLQTFNASQASLWGRLLLQAAGSSPHAWRRALEKFPDPAAAAHWRDAAPLAESWRKKVAVLPPLACAQGGLVVFSQFLETQAALAAALREAGLQTWVINGQTPAPQRQPITEQFRAEGGVLLLTHSGTEGRNLQFCHRLVNFDLPWNPMEIEQRIGRLHRLGQQQPVEIYNLVQAGTLQAHLLDVLQEKLNLFELVVGETGLVLGERYSSDEFAEEIFRRWRDSRGEVAAALQSLGDELQQARAQFEEIKRVDQVLFERDYEAD